MWMLVLEIGDLPSRNIIVHILYYHHLPVFHLSLPLCSAPFLFHRISPFLLLVIVLRTKLVLSILTSIADPRLTAPSSLCGSQTLPTFPVNTLKHQIAFSFSIPLSNPQNFTSAPLSGMRLIVPETRPVWSDQSGFSIY